MKLFLLLSLLIAVSSAYKVFLRLGQYSKFANKEVISNWITDATPDFHVKYHVTHRGVDEKVSFRLEVRSPSPDKPLKDIDVWGHVALIDHINNNKKRGRNLRFQISKDNTISEWFDIIPRKEVLDPAKGWYDPEKDQVLAENGMYYTNGSVAEIIFGEGEKVVDVDLHA